MRSLGLCSTFLQRLLLLWPIYWSKSWELRKCRLIPGIVCLRFLVLVSLSFPHFSSQLLWCFCQWQKDWSKLECLFYKLTLIQEDSKYFQKEKSTRLINQCSYSLSDWLLQQRRDLYYRHVGIFPSVSLLLRKLTKIKKIRIKYV